MGFGRRLAVIAAVVSVMSGLLGTGTAAAGPPEHGYYLSLGDSLAFGYRPDLATVGDFNPADYRGYAEDFAAMRPHLTLVNYGCPGETSTTMLTGGCPWPTRHDSYGGAVSQAAAAEAFLTAHPGRVSLISIAIGSNDLLGVVRPCVSAPDPRGCIKDDLPPALLTLTTNYTALLAHLRTVAPTARIVLFNYYNPLAVKVPGSDVFATKTNAEVVDRLAAQFHASVADAFRTINHAADSRAERVLLCITTWECTRYADVHPTPLGYRALSIALMRATH